MGFDISELINRLRGNNAVILFAIGFLVISFVQKALAGAAKNRNQGEQTSGKVSSTEEIDVSSFGTEKLTKLKKPSSQSMFPDRGSRSKGNRMFG